MTARPAPAPWDFSSAPAPGEPTIENMPTLEGIALGRELARLIDVEEIEHRARFPRMLPRCDDCAGRAGTRPNGCEETLADLIKCSVECVPFYCHKGLKEGEAPRQLCSAFVILMSNFDKKRGE